ncbi:MAG: hypothetical protein J0M04_19950 [Verrucomicrobia bacterium]|nr:hypothetical protein [Verrucomicrobiota bacterium]
MSQSHDTFLASISDATALLELYSTREKATPEELEVLKRAGLIMAFTAWETYVEDRITEAVIPQLKLLEGCQLGKFMKARLDEELKRFNNPNSDKTRKLFLDYTGIDVTACWRWNNFDPAGAKKQLDTWIGIRGEVVHRSLEGGARTIKKDDLRKVISFLTELASATEKALD